LAFRTIAGPLANQFSRFLAAGGIAASANFGSRFLFSEFVAFEAAVVLAFMVGLATGFLLSRAYVFMASANSLGREAIWYVIVNLLALAQTWLVSVYLARALGDGMGVELAQATAHLAGIILPVISSYFGHKYLTFRERAADGE